jgi:hypothetical protein
MSDPEDNDTKIALLASLLDPVSFPLSEYLEALAAASGDVSLAAEALLLPRVKKRRAGTSIGSWLVKGGKRVDQVENNSDEVEEPRRKTLNGSPSKVKPAIDLLSALGQASPTKRPKVKSIPHPALLLTSQAAIDAHNLPVTLLQCPLCPSFASALYLALMEESEKWERNRWYLSGRWVESPHTTTVYARKGDWYGELEVDEHQEERAERGADERGKAEVGYSGGKPRYFYSGNELGTPKVSRYIKTLLISRRTIPHCSNRRRTSSNP